MTPDDTAPHVYARIAEHVSRDDVSVDATQVADIINGDAVPGSWPDEIVEAVLAEAKEYGILEG